LRAVVLDTRARLAQRGEITRYRAAGHSERVHEFGELVNTWLRAKGFENPDAAGDCRARKRQVLAIGLGRTHAGPLRA